MNLSKFLRRYSRILLMVFMSLLLVVFLVGQQLQSCAQRAANPKFVIGTAFGEEIYNTDGQRADAKRQVLVQVGLLNPTWRLEPLDVYLLTEEARRMGVRVGQDQAKEALRGIPDAQQRLTLLQKRTGRSYASMFDVVGEWIAVLRLAAMQNSALGQSLPRAELAYRNEKQQADIQLAVIDAEGFVAVVPEPSEAELQAFFEQAKSRETNHTEEGLEFGYVLPDRVRLEYLTVDARKIERKVRISKREARTFFEEHAANYTKIVAQPPDTQSTDPTKPPRVQMTYEEAEKRVRADARLHKAIEEAQRLMHDIQSAAFRPWQAAQRGESGFRTPPPLDKIESFAALRDRFAERYEVTYVETDLLGQEDIARLFDPRPELIRMGLPRSEPVYFEGQYELPLSQLALRVEGIVTPGPDETLPVLTVLEPSPVLISKQRNPATRELGPYQAYFFRIVEVVPSGPPEALEVVRERLVEDYKLLKALELAGEHAQRLGERARQVGLAAAVAEAAELKDMLRQAEEAAQPVGPPDPRQPPPAPPEYAAGLEPTAQSLTRVTTRVAPLGETRKVPRETFALAETPAGASAAAHRVAVVEVANLFRWAVVELEEVAPLYQGEFDLERDRYLRPSGLAMWAWLVPENVRQRTGFKPAGAADESEQTEQ